MRRALVGGLLVVLAFVVPLVPGRLPPAGAQDATPAASPAAGCPTTTEDENEAIARRWHEDAINHHDLAVLDEILAPDVAHDSATLPDNPGPKVVLGVLLAGFPDVRHTVDDVIADGDLVAVRYTATGTQTGEFQGIPPTGKRATWTGINIYRIECGRIAEVWSEVDGLGRLQQLGVLPSPTSAASPSAGGGTAASPGASPTACPTTTEAENVALARAWHEEVINRRNPAALRDILAPTVVHHAAGGYPQLMDEAGVTAMMGDFLGAFSDLRYSFDLFAVQDDEVVERYTATGTQDGPLGDLPPSGRAATWTGINIFRIECGKIAEVWSQVDALGRTAQLTGAAAAATPEGTPTP